MIPVTDQELDATWRTTVDNEIALCEWRDIMQEAGADAMLEQAARNLGLMVLCMVGGVEYEQLLDTLDYEDWQEDEAFFRRGMQ